MKKLGFTLAEVLITLGIVGVIAAITLPALMADTTSAQIGPKLAKAVAAFEQANEVLLNQNGADRLSDTGLINDGDHEAYTNELSKYLKISPTSHNTKYPDMGNGAPSSAGKAFLSKDGVIYIIYTQGWQGADNTIPSYKKIQGQIWIDINGVSKPNEGGVDGFAFALMNDGSLQPGGSTFLTENHEYPHWTDGCPEGGIIDNDHSGTCAGHIFENNLKVLYK